MHFGDCIIAVDMAPRHEIHLAVEGIWLETVTVDMTLKHEIYLAAEGIWSEIVTVDS